MPTWSNTGGSITSVFFASHAGRIGRQTQVDKPDMERLLAKAAGMSNIRGRAKARQHHAKPSSWRPSSVEPNGKHKKMIDRDKRDALNTLIGEQVMHVLGQPDDLLRVQIRRLWEGRYRVNVLVGADIASARVAHSYFLVADVDGTITAATPEIIKRY